MAINRLPFDADRIKQAVKGSLGGRQALGTHESAAGGLWRAVERISSLHGGVLQIFTRNQRQWTASPLAEEEIADFLAARRPLGRSPRGVARLVPHQSGIAGQRSLAALRAGPEPGAWALPPPWASPGWWSIQALPWGRIRGRRSGAWPWGWTAPLKPTRPRPSAEAPAQILLENVAGQGTNLGKTFEELGAHPGLRNLSGTAGPVFRHLPRLCRGLRSQPGTGIRGRVDSPRQACGAGAAALDACQ